MVVKNILKQKGYEFEEVDINSEEGKEIVKRFNIMNAGAIYDTDSNQIVELNNL